MPKITLFTLATAALLCGVSAYDTFVGCRNAPMSVVIQGSAAKVDTTALCAVSLQRIIPDLANTYSYTANPPTQQLQNSTVNSEI